MTSNLRVLIVDDSPFYGAMLREILNPSAGFDVVAVATHAQDAREKIKKFNPDVVTLDVEMPQMNGIEFLEKIMTLRPMPVVMVSTLTGAGTEIALRALEIGAVDCVAKPSADIPEDLSRFAEEVTEKVRVAALVRISNRLAAMPAPKHAEARTLLPHAPDIIALGASTGGVEALTALISFLPTQTPPVVIVQHMPPIFTRSFANRLSKASAMDVQEAYDGCVLKRGVAWVAPGGQQMTVSRQGKVFTLKISQAPPVNKHCPSVDVLFQSIAHISGVKVLAALLTGMGKDGAEGLLALRQAGAHTIAQDEATCVVYGMPRAAVQLDAVDEILPLPRIAKVISDSCFHSET